MFWIVHDHSGGDQGTVLDAAADVAHALWIGIDRAPPDVTLYDYWKEQPFEALSASAARLYHRDKDKKDLVISTMAGFLGPAMRAPRSTDHTSQTLNFAKVVCLRGLLPEQIIIAGLSLMYERALALIGGTITQAKLSPDNALKLVPDFAGSAICHLCTDFMHSGIPLIASATTVEQGKRQVPYLPRNLANLADRVITPEEFDLEEWKQGVRNAQGSDTTRSR